MQVKDLLNLCQEMIDDGKGDYIVNIDGIPLTISDIDILDAFKQLCIGWVK